MAQSHPTEVQKRWLRRGLEQPGGKLPLFDTDGRKVAAQTVRSCLEAGWVEPWFANPTKPDWLVCKLTPTGRALLAPDPPAAPPPARHSDLEDPARDPGTVGPTASP